jgi:hypothetical protein
MAPSSRHLIQIKADLSHAIKLKVADKPGAIRFVVEKPDRPAGPAGLGQTDALRP